MNKIKFSREDALSYRNQGMSYFEIAEMMGCSEAWVKKELRGVPKGNSRVAVDGTRLKAIAILEEALKKIKEIK